MPINVELCDDPCGDKPVSPAPSTQHLIAGDPGPSEDAPVCGAPSAREGLRPQTEQLQRLVEQAENLPDPAARKIARECLESLLALYGNGLARILQIVREHPAAGEQIIGALTRDPTVSGLLLIHGLHPIDLSTRLRAALDKVRPVMESHGGSVELLGLQDGFARLRLKGNCHGCPSSSVTLQLAVRSALEELCPDLAGYEVE